MTIKIIDGKITGYSIRDLRTDNPNKIFPKVISEETLNAEGVYTVATADKPNFDDMTQKLESSIQNVNGTYTRVWTVVDLSSEEKLSQVYSMRKSEYPPIEDYIDGIVKGDDAQVQDYIDACNAVKLKYPKPTKG